MDPIRNILVIVDPTAKEHPAVVKGAALAEKFAARLDLFVCDTKASRNIRQAELARRPADPPNVADLKSVLEGLANPLRARGLDVTTECVSGDPLHAMLLDRVKRTCAELVIKDTHHHTVAERTILTNTDWELIRGCPTTLLLTKPKPWASVVRVCAAVDPGHQDDKPRLLDGCILEQASELARRTAGELHMAHVYVPTAFVAAAGSMPPMVIDVSPEALDTERRTKVKDLVALASEYGIPEPHVHLRVGGTSNELCHLAAELNVDVMAMGAVSRSALKRAFIGSTAENVLERLPCDLWIVKAPNFAELLAL
jgi:universal stress protein E